jgi:hypothetical protein
MAAEEQMVANPLNMALTGELMSVEGVRYARG